MKKVILLLLVPAVLWICLFDLAGCGVKGKPLPPLTPPILGRGEPNYSRATQNVKVQKQPTKKAESQGDDWNNDDFSSEKSQ